MRESNGHKYEVVKRELIAKIESGALKAGDRLPSENEIVESFEVSIITARKALNDLVNLGLAYRQRGKGSFVQINNRQNSIGSFSTQNQSKLVSLLMPTASSGEESTAKILQGAQSFLSQNDYKYQVWFSGINIDEERKFLTKFINEDSQGLICFSLNPDANSEKYRQILNTNKPLVFIDRGLKNVSTNLVKCDNFEGARLSTEFLISKGHRNIAFMTMDSYLESERQRINGYREALLESGIPFKEENIYNLAELDNFLNEFATKQVTAIVCVNDNTASKVMRHGIKSGIQVPENLSIIGFDNIVICKHLPVKLSTIHQPFTEIGLAAAQLLDRALKEKATFKSQIILPVRLVLRESHKNLE